MKWSSACALVLLALAGRSDAKCDEKVVEEIQKLHPDAAELTALLEKVEGDFEITELYVGDHTDQLGDHCIQLKFTNQDGKKYLEFHGFHTPRYPFALKEGKLVYEGKRVENNKETKNGESEDNAKEKDRKTGENKPKESKVDENNSAYTGNKGKKNEDANKGESKKEDIKKDDTKMEDATKDATKKEGDEKKEYQVKKDVKITYYVVQRTNNLVVLYTCSDIADEPALTFIAVATNSKQQEGDKKTGEGKKKEVTTEGTKSGEGKTEEAKRAEIKAEEENAIGLLKKLGIQKVKKMPSCKDERRSNNRSKKKVTLKSGHRTRGKRGAKRQLKKTSTMKSRGAGKPAKVEDRKKPKGTKGGKEGDKSKDETKEKPKIQPAENPKSKPNGTKDQPKKSKDSQTNGVDNNPKAKPKDANKDGDKKTK